MFETFKDMVSCGRKISKLNKTIQRLEDEIDFLRSRLDLGTEMIDDFYVAKQTEEYHSLYLKDNPLVSVCIATYNRSELLVERSVRSVLDQTYKNIEVIVVGDCCSDDTESRIHSVDDKRVKFFNLPQRGAYPLNPELRWMVAGTSPMNKSLEIAEGDFITHLDDDDMYERDRIEKLVEFILKTKSDAVWHPFWLEGKRGWGINKSTAFRKGHVSTSTVMYHRWFKRIPWDINAYRNREPGDWNRYRKFKYLGAKLERYPEPLLRHYMQQTQLGK